MRKKTLQHFKDEVAKKFKRDSWDELNHTIKTGRIRVPAKYIPYEDAAERYAQYLAGEAWVEGYNLGCARESSMHIASNPYKQKEA